MTTTTQAAALIAGQTIETIPSIASGRRTTTTGVVTDVERFNISDHQFVEIHLGPALSVTMSADTLVVVR